MNPNGGWDARFPGLSLPTLGFSTLGPSPSNDFVTKVYTAEYDGWADFPRYPINVLSDLNAVAGMVTVHLDYDTLSSTAINSAIVLPSDGPTMTTYYMIPQNLPLLEPLRLIPYVGNPIADLVQPVLEPLVNWGYGDPNFGWSTGPANVTTPFGFLPPLSDTTALGPALVGGVHTGIGAMISDFQAEGPPQLPSLSGISQTLTSLFSGSGTLSLPSSLLTGLPTVNDIISGIQTANTQIANAATTATSTAYSTLLPTADIAAAALVSLPSYDLNQFLDGVLQMVNGQPVAGLVNAIGLPIAANVGLLPLLGALEVAVIGEAAYSIVTGTPYGTF